jgi:putative MATE family efflux protein
MERDVRPFRRSIFDRDIFALAIPALGALAADPLVSLIDTAFVGRLGAVQLGALGVNTAVFWISFIVFNFLAYGTTPRVARAYGRRDIREAGRVVVQAMYIAIVLGFAAAMLLFAFAGPVLRVMGASGPLFDEALVYLQIRAWAGPAVLIITASHGAFRGYQDTRTPLIVTLALNLVNLVLDPLLIFGLGWGLAGAAWATLAAQWFGALWFLWLVFVKRRAAMGVEPHVPRLNELRPFLRIGWELLLRTFALIATLTLATAVATRVGTREVAAHQIATQLWIFLALTVDAIAVAAQAMVARLLGAGKRRAARAAADRMLYLGLLGGLILAAGFAMASPFLPGVFTDDPEVIALIYAIFPIIILMQPLNALVFVADGIFIGAEDFPYLAKAMIVSALVSATMLILVNPLGWGLTGVWWAIIALMGVRLVTLGVRYPRLFA